MYIIHVYNIISIDGSAEAQQNYDTFFIFLSFTLFLAYQNPFYFFLLFASIPFMIPFMWICVFCRRAFRKLYRAFVKRCAQCSLGNLLRLFISACCKKTYIAFATDCNERHLVWHAIWDRYSLQFHGHNSNLFAKFINDTSALAYVPSVKEHIHLHIRRDQLLSWRAETRTL